MKASFLVLVIAISTAFGQEVKLPADASGIILALQDFEKAELAKAEKAISEKREVAIRILRDHLKREVQTGDLDTALELKKTIESLVAANAPAPIPAQVANLDGSLNLVGTRWKTTWDHGTVFEFHKEGKLKVIVPAYPAPVYWKYRIADGKVFATPPGDHPEREITMKDGNTRFDIYHMGEFQLLSAGEN